MNKIKTYIYFVFSVFALLVFISCVDLFSPLNIKDVNSEVVRIYIGENNLSSRTVQPGYESLAGYQLTFSGTVTRNPVNITGENFADVILADGNWTITATAYRLDNENNNTIGNSDYAVASGTINITLSGGVVSGTIPAIILKSLNKSGDGTLNLITPYLNYANGFIKLWEIDGVTPINTFGTDGIFSISWWHSVSSVNMNFIYQPGRYIVEIELSQDGNYEVCAYYREIIEIWEGTTTVVNFSPSIFGNQNAVLASSEAKLSDIYSIINDNPIGNGNGNGVSELDPIIYYFGIPNVNDVSMHLEFERSSLFAIVSWAVVNSGSTPSSYSATALPSSIDFSNNKVLWIKAVSEDGSTTMYYKFEIIPSVYYGDFNVINTNNSAISYSNGVLTISGNGPYIIGMKSGVTNATADRIVVASGTTADITLSGVNIDTYDYNNWIPSNSPFDMTGSTVNLTLAGNNKGSGGRAGILVPEGATLVITEESKGSLDVSAGDDSAGIGGGYNNVNAGFITINGGTITATVGGDRYGAGIGGGNGGNGGTITINGGTVTAVGGRYSAGIGCGYGGNGGIITINGGTVTASGGNRGQGLSGNTINISGGIVTSVSGTSTWGDPFININCDKLNITGGIIIANKNWRGFDSGINANTILIKNAVAFASSFSRELIENNNVFDSIIFNGNTGTLYGDAILNKDVTFDEEKELTIPEEKSLTIPSGVTLTNNGLIIKFGTIINNGTINGSGNIVDGYYVYPVNFNTNGGTPIPSSQELKAGETVTEPETQPIKAGYDFGGWYQNEDCTISWNYATDTVKGETTIYAKWNIKQYTVTFNSNGGASVDSQNINHGSNVVRPNNPTKSEYGFIDWYSDSSLKNPYNFNTPITEAITLFARWGTPVTSAQDVNDFGTDAGIANIFNVLNITDWNNAISVINTDGNNKNFIINIGNSFAIPGSTAYTFTPSDIIISIRGIGIQILSLSTVGNLLRINSNQSVIIYDLTLKGRTNGIDGADSHNNKSLVDNSGIIELKGTTTITGNTFQDLYNSSFGGGVDNSGIFIMRDNTSIINNSCISNLTQWDNSYASSHGGGVYNYGGTFIMRGNSSIKNNILTSTKQGGNISGECYSRGGGIYNGRGAFYIEGGIISGNTGSATNSTEGTQLFLYYNANILNPIAEYGIFNETFNKNNPQASWSRKGSLSTSNNLITVVNGVLNP